jgi:hypothetical protein
MQWEEDARTLGALRAARGSYVREIPGDIYHLLLGYVTYGERVWDLSEETPPTVRKNERDNWVPGGDVLPEIDGQGFHEFGNSFLGYCVQVMDCNYDLRRRTPDSEGRVAVVVRMGTVRGSPHGWLKVEGKAGGVFFEALFSDGALVEVMPEELWHADPLYVTEGPSSGNTFTLFRRSVHTRSILSINFKRKYGAEVTTLLLCAEKCREIKFSHREGPARLNIVEEKDYAVRYRYGRAVVERWQSTVERFYTPHGELARAVVGVPRLGTTPPESRKVEQEQTVVEYAVPGGSIRSETVERAGETMTYYLWDTGEVRDLVTSHLAPGGAKTPHERREWRRDGSLRRHIKEAGSLREVARYYRSGGRCFYNVASHTSSLSSFALAKEGKGRNAKAGRKEGEELEYDAAGAPVARRLWRNGKLLKETNYAVEEVDTSLFLRKFELAEL